MDYARFQIAVVELADEGTDLTTANVVAGLRIEPDEAERHLRRMARENRVEIEDESDGVITYRVRGLSPRRKSKGAGATLKSLRDAATASLIEQKLGSMLGLGEKKPGVPLPAAMQRKISLGAILGGVVPGLGLAYAAPWKVVAIGTVAVIVGWKVLAFVSLGLAVPFLVIAAVASGVLGGLYTWQYNNMGRRAALGEDPTMRKLQSKIKL